MKHGVSSAVHVLSVVQQLQPSLMTRSLWTQTNFSSDDHTEDYRDRDLMTHFYFSNVIFVTFFNWNSSKIYPKTYPKNSPRPKFKSLFNLVFCLKKLLVPGLELSVLFVISLMEWNRNNKGRMGGSIISDLSERPVELILKSFVMNHD